VRVTDNGVGNLAATQSFNVAVNPLNRPLMSGVQLTNGQFRMTITGDFGPDYTLQASTNLTSWVTLFTSNSPALPFHWTDSSSTNVPLRFYRLLLGP
jgi:hypothetical protein